MQAVKAGRLPRLKFPFRSICVISTSVFFSMFLLCFFHSADSGISVKSSDKITLQPTYPKCLALCAILGTSIPTGRARASSTRRASSYKTHTCSSFFLTRYSNGCTRRSLLLRAEWALVDEILTSENRNPLRDLQRGSPPPLLTLSSLSLSFSFSFSPTMTGGGGERRERDAAARREKRNEGKRQRLGRSVGRSRIQHEFKGGGTWMTSTFESLPLCARYIWMLCVCVYARIYITRTKKHVRCAPRAWLADWGG